MNRRASFLIVRNLYTRHDLDSKKYDNSFDKLLYFTETLLNRIKHNFKMLHFYSDVSASTRPSSGKMIM